MPRTGLSADQMREKAVDAALARMRLVGFDKVRLSDVARDIGVSHAALYPLFADKAALLDAVTERWLAAVERAAAAVAAAPGAAEARIEAWFVTLYRLKRARALDDPEPHRAFDVAAARERPFVVAHLDGLAGQLAGLVAETGAAEAARAAQLLFEATTAFHHPTLVAQTAAQDREPQLRALVALLLRGLSAGAAPQRSRSSPRTAT